MTRFARAKGSKASNERTPEDATSWSEMKNQLEEKTKEIEHSIKQKEANLQREANYKKFLQEKEEDELKKTTWADFPGMENKKSKKTHKTELNNNKKKSKKDTVDSDSDAPPDVVSSKIQQQSEVVTKKPKQKKKLLKIIADKKITPSEETTDVNNKNTQSNGKIVTALSEEKRIRQRENRKRKRANKSLGIEANNDSKNEETTEANEEENLKKPKLDSNENKSNWKPRKEIDLDSLPENEKKKILKKREKHKKQLEKRKAKKAQLKLQKEEEMKNNPVQNGDIKANDDNLNDKLSGLNYKETNFNDKNGKFNDKQHNFNEQENFNDKQGKFNDKQEKFNDKQGKFNDQQENFNKKGKFNDKQQNLNDKHQNLNGKEFSNKKANNDTKNQKKSKKIKDNEVHNRKKPLLPSKMMINGREIEVDYVEGFPVKKEDAERLKKLRKEMISKGLPRSEINVALKLERRKAEKAFAREKKKVCFHCRKSGHNLSDCPNVGNDELTQTAGSGICFKCGSTEHTHFECKVVRGQEFKFASCFICNEQGHIARQCPDNSRGLYPKGGACNVCGDVTHFKKDCPKYLAEKERAGDKFNVGTLSGENPDNLESGSSSLAPISNIGFKKPNKIIKF